MKEGPTVAPVVEDRVGITLDSLTDYFVLDGIKGFGPQKFKQLHECGMSPSDIVDRPDQLPIPGKRGDQFREDLTKNKNKLREECAARAARQLIAANKVHARIVCYKDPAYPANVYRSNDPIPILYVRGSLDVLSNRRTVACVGSRAIREPYTLMVDEFARHAAHRDFTVVSGFALGADTIAHKAAVAQGGKTIAVMPCGLDRLFPPENKGFWNDLLTYPKATLVSEFAFGTSAKSLTLRKRNKLIVAFALGVLIGQSSVKGGAMNAYRFALEQGKPISTFAADGREDTSGNQKASEDAKSEPLTFSHLGNSNDLFDQWLERLSSLI